MRFSYLFIFFLSIFNLVEAQKINPNQITDICWGFDYFGRIGISNNDTVQLSKVTNLDSIWSYNYYGGFIFYKNGTFKEIKRPKESSDRKPYTGSWILENDTIRVTISRSTIWNFQCIEVNENTLTVKYWLTKNSGN